MDGTRIFFDLDSTVVHALDYDADRQIEIVRTHLGDEFFESVRTVAMKYVHLVLPGYFALFRHLRNHGVQIGFCSSGIRQRNEELVPQLLQKAFPNDHEEILPNVPIFSREDLFDTTKLPDEEGDKYQVPFYGNYKKRLVGMAITEDELPNSIVVDDDRSYLATGEEKSFLRVQGTSLQYCPNPSVPYFEHDARGFHSAYYVAGILDEVARRMQSQGVTISDALWSVQVVETGKPFDRDFQYPTSQDPAYYERGLEILRAIDPSLRIYLDLKGTYHFERPAPRPEKD